MFGRNKLNPIEDEANDVYESSTQLPCLVLGLLVVGAGVLFKIAHLFGQLGTILLILGVPITALFATDFVYYHLRKRARRSL